MQNLWQMITIKIDLTLFVFEELEKIGKMILIQKMDGNF